MKSAWRFLYISYSYHERQANIVLLENFHVFITVTRQALICILISNQA
jgi:hypothetical protein